MTCASALHLEMPDSCQSGHYYEPTAMTCQSCPANASLVTSADVTQNIDGSPLKEVQCMKCARGFRAENNVCVKCESCVCTKSQIVVRGICVPKSYINNRPKYEENSLHPLALLDVVKHEYSCTQNDFRACRTLASECVKNFYSTDLAGPCRLWIQSKIPTPKGLPLLTVQSSLTDKYPGETNLPRGKDSLIIAAAVYTSQGGVLFLKDPSQQVSPCYLPINIQIGRDFTVERDKNSQGSLKLYISIEANYATKSQLSNTIVTTLKVIHVMPEAGVHRGLEIWGGVLGSVLALYAMVQWRGTVRRGGLYISIVPLLAGSIADTLYFATLFSTLHALAAEAGTLGLTLPLSRVEEYLIKALIYSAVSLKAFKVAWINIKQCRSDIFFLDWSEYNPPFKDACTMDKPGNWRAVTLSREWSRMQTMRRVSTGHTVILALLILHLLRPWQSYLPPSLGYKWAVATIAWWSSYTTFLLARLAWDRLVASPVKSLPKICTNVDLGETETRQALLSRFLAAFFERALDGLSWVASELTILERLLDVELTTREAGNTSILLYDPANNTPSCFAVTWWGEEWNLSTFDAMVFGSVFIALNDALLAALITVILCQAMKILRRLFGNKNQRDKTEIDFY
ncbi:unnamed protein product [Arctia plantaginis]|uniref:Meckelin n=1 Tax=Arctia plantaginis TaxID=874455 RepID=A0A8S1A5P0_ARCPL|nr:unnamed protein product [Arctia plantaginis]